MEMSRPRGAQTLARGLEVLAALRDEPAGLSVADLIRVLGFPRAVMTRLLVTLEDEGYVERADGRAYRLGPTLISLGQAVRTDLTDAATTILRDLAEQVSATVVLVVRHRNDGVVVSVIEPAQAHLRLLFRLGSRHPLRQGAEGMAILAGNPPVAGERAEVTEARNRGYAISQGEILPGTWGLAAPVPGRDGRCDLSVGVVAATALETDVTAKLVIDAASRVAVRVGGSR